MKRSAADIIQEYGPFPDTEQVAGVSFDGRNIWVAAGNGLKSVDPGSGELQRSLDMPAHAGTAFDGKHLYQIEDKCIHKIDPESGRVLATIPAPGENGNSGLAWAEGSLWVGEYRARKIHQIDPETGALRRTIESRRFVTGVAWVDGELWHATWEDEKSDIRRIDTETGEVREQIDMPDGMTVAGLEYDGDGRFLCGGGNSGKVRVVRRPRHDQ